MINFNYPYLSKSIREFWNRWHISLSSWFKEYLYIPLGGNKVSATRNNFNLLFTFLVSGLWHGANWTFLFWGALHGGGLIIERHRRARRAITGKAPPPGWLSWLVTFNFVCFAWIFFRANSFDQAASVIERLFTGWGEPSPDITLGVLAAVAVGMGIQFLPSNWWQSFQTRVSQLPYAAQGVGLGFTLMFINALGPSGVAPFIYFQF